LNLPWAGGGRRSRLPCLSPPRYHPAAVTVRDLLSRWGSWLLAIAFVLPNLNALACGFVLDDLPLIVESEKLHSIRNVLEIWRSGYWPDRAGLTLYRPVTQTFWMLLWEVGRAQPFAFHLFNLLVGCAVVVLLYRLLRELGFEIEIAFCTSLLFAVLPIHTEATTSVVGSAELLAALFSLLALLFYRRERPILAIVFFALAVFSKESAAAVAAVGWLITPAPRSKRWKEAVAAAAVIALALWARSAIASAPSFIPPIDNATALLPFDKRILTALWVQFLYLWKTFVPIHLSADYSYKQIRLVMGMSDWRAWAGLAALVAWIVLAARKTSARGGALVYGALFLPAANLLFPIGTIMGERLAYAPSAGILLAVVALAFPRRKATKKKKKEPEQGHLREVMIALVCVVAVLYAIRGFVRNGDWRDAHVFYRKLIQTSPDSSKAHYFYGALLASEGNDLGAIIAYDRAIAIFPAYSEAFHNRGNALARLGRYAEAAESYRNCLRFDPGHQGAARNLAAIERGEALFPTRRAL
jgi:protein O-mannosyl-transferase